MRRLLGTSLALAIALAGCGGDDDEGATIPRREARAMVTQLDQIASQVRNGACNGAQAKFGELQARAEKLPSDLNQDVRDALEDGIGKLGSAIDNDCQAPEQTTTEQTQPTTTQETLPTTTEETETQPTTTEEEQPTTTEEQPTTTEQIPTEPPPDDGGAGIPPGDGGAGPGDDG